MLARIDLVAATRIGQIVNRIHEAHAIAQMRRKHARGVLLRTDHIQFVGINKRLPAQYRPARIAGTAGVIDQFDFNTFCIKRLSAIVVGGRPVDADILLATACQIDAGVVDGLIVIV
jgi:hypothetical protein